MIVDLFGRYLDGYGHGGLNEFDRARLEREERENCGFCDIFAPVESTLPTSTSSSAAS